MSDFFGLNVDVKATINVTLGDYKRYKRYRDKLIHAHIIDAKAGVGLMISYQGVARNLLLTQEAIDSIYDGLVLVRKELQEIATIFQLMGVRLRIDPVFLGDLKTGPTAGDLQKRIEQVRLHQRHRSALQPLPELQDEPQAAQETS